MCMGIRHPGFGKSMSSRLAAHVAQRLGVREYGSAGVTVNTGHYVTLMIALLARALRDFTRSLASRAALRPGLILTR